MSEQSPRDLVASSAITFTGTVQSLGQSPEPGFEANDRTALVQVDQPLHAPDDVDLSPGASVVVQLKEDLPALQPGDHVTFFSNPLIYGNSLVVQEVNRSEEPPRAGRTAARVAAAELEQDAVIEHARAADAVVRGSVVGLRAAESNPEREHDPHWWIATLEVDLVARGDVGEGELELVYANSIDRRWREWPKPKAGQAGMWILHATDGEVARLAGFQLMHPEDLQPSTLLDALLGEAPEEPEQDDEGDDDR
jgi:hypothetical protein